MRARPTGLVVEPIAEEDLGTLKSGKEAQVNLIEWSGLDGNRSLVARKRYLPRTVTDKGQLEALGVSRASTFRHDVQYREGRQFRKSRDRRAIARMTTHGKALLQHRWMGHEFEVLSALWDAGAAVPYPISFAGNVLDMSYVGDLSGAAPQLARARLRADEIAAAWEQVYENLRTITEAGWAHGDLSAFNLLWWEDHVCFIDFPQAVDIAANPGGLSFLHRDVCNVVAWFARRGIEDDPEEVFADLLGAAFG